MKLEKIFLVVVVFFSLVSFSFAQPKKLKIFVVSSYNREYLWEQEVNEGFCTAMLDFKFLDNKEQAQAYTQNDYIQTDKLVLQKAWMDTKRKSSKTEIQQSTLRILGEIKAFKPDLIILGDDNASNYIGTQYIDTDTPVVFRGIVGTPVKYGLADSIEHPGHNITGVLKQEYPKDTIENLLKLIPSVKTFAILGDGSETSRGKTKNIVKYQEAGSSPVKLVDTVLTNSFKEWKAAALRLQNQVDAFYIINHNTLKDENNVSVDPFEVMAWQLRYIKKPECVGEKQFVQEGALITVDDSAFKQGYEVVRMAHMVIHEKKNPGDIPCMTPTRGAIIVNRQRAQMLGIDLTDKKFIEQYIDRALSLEKYPQ